MTPAARVQAAVEILDQVIDAARSGGAAADTLIARYFKDRRYAGSKDRRAVRDLVYRAIRRSAERPESGRAALIGLAHDDDALITLFDGSPHGPAPIASGEAGAEAGLVPQWLQGRLDPLVTADEWPALLERAPLDVRVNRLKGTVQDARSDFPEAAPLPHSPVGLRLPEGFAVEQTVGWASGLVEIQDEGSQLLSLACAARPGMTVVDLCAGAGGKTLALAADMANSGRIIAADVDRARLSRIAPRVERAGASIVEIRLLDPGKELEALGDLHGAADLVLIDAPCSGTGTWRRNPETRWRLTSKRLARLAATQAHLLDIGAALVRPGGHLVYAVCSLLAEEGRGQAEAFAARRSAFISERPAIEAGRPAGAGTVLTPGHDGTDGFFVARWRAP
ncbi:RsmB/NOP family class I SAM-dependent RNA methyltransferase [Allosphingosinicella flava]|uniref:RsmB/NOP family class I SAM-dependent RNA methyltransferase n=1 Tax=Allosphingosinicella flava TaxID=2771430 RepID=A0A7T2GLD5_9SPHN|nr:RsmB/NOP family class I SAM-dependent RNA methyltransferase [Sphingosinicella flava]QPQ55653.1 RsmB/NOP family class I SAM-dependent RNA methyltransferase [Sphingosinicella flava]